MEEWLGIVLATVIWEALSAIVGFGLGVAVVRLFTVKDLRNKVAELEERLEDALENTGQEDDPAPDSASVGYAEAIFIIERYIGPALVDKRPGVRITTRQKFLDRFARVTGAKVGENLYNRALLHEWMQTNAAEFLVEHQEEMR